MNKRILLIALGAFVAGAAAGAIATWIYRNRLEDEEYEAEEAEFISRIKNNKEDKSSDELEKDAVSKFFKDATDDLCEEDEAKDELLERYKSIATDYQKAYGPYDVNDEIEEDEKMRETLAKRMKASPLVGEEDQDLDSGQRDPDRNGKPPYIIPEDEYMHGDDSYAKCCVTLYIKDRVLCDTDGSVMDIPRVIGDLAADLCVNGNTDVYVRNERLGCDYEVVGVASYFIEPEEDEEDDEYYEDCDDDLEEEFYGD